MVVLFCVIWIYFRHEKWMIRYGSRRISTYLGRGYPPCGFYMPNPWKIYARINFSFVSFVSFSLRFFNLFFDPPRILIDSFYNYKFFSINLWNFFSHFLSLSSKRFFKPLTYFFPVISLSKEFSYSVSIWFKSNKKLYNWLNNWLNS